MTESDIKTVRRHFRQAQLPLWEAICDLQVAGRNGDLTSSLRRLGHNPAVAAVPHLQALRLTLLGDQARRRGRRRIALNHWGQAADILDKVRAKLPPIDLRTAFFARRSEPHQRLIDAEAEHDPLSAAAWSERFKTAGVWSDSAEALSQDPARERVRLSLARLARHVSTMSSLVGDASGRRTAFGSLSDAATRRWQREIREAGAVLTSAELEPTAQCDFLAQQITEVSHRLPIVQFHVGASDILVFVHYRGESHAHRYLEGRGVLAELVARWRFFVECAPLAATEPRRVDLDDERRLLHQIGQWLLPPLQLPSRCRRLLVLPEGNLTCLPWSALGAGPTPLVESTEIVLAPSLRHFSHACRRRVASRSVNLFVGPSPDLPHIRAELAAIHSYLKSRTVEIYDPCRRSDWPDGGDADIWHYAGHALLRSDNPFYSALLTDDGPLFAADFRLKHNHVNLVTLAACRTGQQTGLPAEESSGLVRSLLEMGARSVVAGNWAIADESTHQWMSKFYESYMSGATVAAAVRDAALGVRERFPSAYHWGAFAAYGAA